MIDKFNYLYINQFRSFSSGSMYSCSLSVKNIDYLTKNLYAFKAGGKRINT